MNTGNDNSDRNASDDALLRALRRLPQEIDPPRDLWADIDAGIHAHPAPASLARGVSAERGHSIRWPYALAAGFGCMALGALLAFALLRTSNPAVQSAATANAPAALVPDVRYGRASFGGYEALGPEYERARAQLAIGLAERIDRLPPDAQQKIERNLAEIRRSLREINVALALEPDNTMLQQLLLSTYQSELTVLANVNQMAGNIPARTET